MPATGGLTLEEANDRPDNPYTQLEGYSVIDGSGEEVGEIEDTGRAIPADQITVDAEDQRVSVPYEAATIESAPKMEKTSGAFDDLVREHYDDFV
jgi:ribosomal 30S subunit maturation factor RimM